MAPVKRNFNEKSKKKVIKVANKRIIPITPNIFGVDSNSSKKDIYWL